MAGGVGAVRAGLTWAVGAVRAGSAGAGASGRAGRSAGTGDGTAGQQVSAVQPSQLGRAVAVGVHDDPRVVLGRDVTLVPRGQQHRKEVAPVGTRSPPLLDDPIDDLVENGLGPLEAARGGQGQQPG